jgi:hypothetical protein
MSFSTFIENLRTRPEKEKMSLAILSASAVAFILFVIWLATLVAGGGGASIATQNDQQAAAAGSLNDLAEEARNAAAAFESQYEQLRRALSDEGFYTTGGGKQEDTVIELYVDENGETQAREVRAGGETESSAPFGQ